jgi:hypothetical protein
MAAAPRPDRPSPEGRTAAAPLAGRPAPTPRPRPDPRPHRIAIGMGALATASALVTALTAPSGGAAGPVAQPRAVAVVDPSPVIRHVIQYVRLKPGQMAPPKAVVRQAPALKPRVVVVTTRQSGAVP